MIRRDLSELAELGRGFCPQNLDATFFFGHLGTLSDRGAFYAEIALLEQDPLNLMQVMLPQGVHHGVIFSISSLLFRRFFF